MKIKSNKIKAIMMRKGGASYQKISHTLKIPKSTLAYWFKDLNWSTVIKHRLTIQARQKAQKWMTILSHRARNKRLQFYKNKKIQAQQLFPTLKKQLLFISGLMAYWGEGDSNLHNGIIRVTNTDPMMLKTFRLFIKKFLPHLDAKIKAYLILYPDLRDKNCKLFWARKLNLPIAKFTKSHYIRGRHPTKRLSYGICTIIATSRADKEMVLAWIDLLRQDIDTVRV